MRRRDIGRDDGEAGCRVTCGRGRGSGQQVKPDETSEELRTPDGGSRGLQDGAPAT